MSSALPLPPQGSQHNKDTAAELELQSIMGRSGGGAGSAGESSGGAWRPLPSASAAAESQRAPLNDNDPDDPERGWWPAPSRPPNPTLEDQRRQRRTAIGFMTVGAVLLALALLSSLGGGGGGGGAGNAPATTLPAAAAPTSSTSPPPPPPPPPAPQEDAAAIWSEDSVADLGGDGLTPDAAASAAGGTGGASSQAAAAQDEADLERAVAALGDRYVPCVGSSLRCDVLHPRPLPAVDFRGVPRHAVARVAATGGGAKRKRRQRRMRRHNDRRALAQAADEEPSTADGRGMVAADSSRCSEVGRDVLLEGGNAADAAVAVGLCQGVVSPMSCGLGGGAFILVRMSEEGAAEAKAGRAAARAAAGASETWAAGEGDDDGSGSGSASDAPLAEFIDARETAPAAATEDMYAGKDAAASAEGGLSVAVPTELLGYARLFARHGSGRVPWSRLVEPAAELARAGFAAHPYLVHTLAGNRTLARVRRNKVLREAFLIREDGGDGGGDKAAEEADDGASWRPPLPGELCCRRPALAATLERIAAKGPRYLYEGEAAEALAAAVVSAGGVLTADDLRTARAEAGIAPFEVDVPLPGAAAAGPASLRLVLPPPPSSAAVVAFGLRFLAGYLAGANGTAAAGAAAGDGDASADADALAAFAALSDADDADSETASAGLWAHRLSEALKHGFAARTALGDGAFPGLPPKDAEDIAAAASDLAQNASYCDALRLETRDDGVLGTESYGGRWNPLKRAAPPPPEDHGTSHFSIVDSKLSAVAITTTVNMVFGSGVADPVTGIILNDEMDDFSQPGRASFVTPRPVRANFIAPGKRPLSAMSPMFALDGASGRLRAAIGGSGGPLIVSSTLQVLARALLLPRPAAGAAAEAAKTNSSSTAWPLGAVAAPRLHAQLLPSSAVLVEEFHWGRTAYRWPQPSKEGMAARGQALREIAGGLGVVQMVLVEEGSEGLEGGNGGGLVLHGVSDPRKDGAPMAA